MAGLLQTVKPVAASNNALQATTPVKTKIGNKKVTPVQAPVRQIDPRNSDGRLINTTGPVPAPVIRPYDGSTTPNASVTSTKDEPRRVAVPRAEDGSVLRETQTPTGGILKSPWAPSMPVDIPTPTKTSDPIGYRDPVEPEKDTPASSGDDLTEYDGGTVTPTPVSEMGLPEIKSSPISVRSTPSTRDTVAGKNYSYEANLIDPSSVAQPNVAPTATVNDVPRPDAISGDYASIEKPDVTEADYSNIEAPEQQSNGLTDDSSVVNQLTGLLSANNPYIKQARQQAAEAAASRGLRNSSMAVQAGQEAAISQALPLAQQDAQQSFQLERDASQANYAQDMARFQSQLQGRRDATLQKYGLDKAGYDAMLQGERDRVMQEYNLDARQYDAALNEIRDQNLAQYQLDQMGYQADLQNVRDQNLTELDKEKMTLQQQYTQDLEQLRYQQQQGLMDRESELQLRQLEKNAQLQQQRDQLLQQMQERTDTMRHGQQLEAMQKEFGQRMTGMGAEMDHQNRLNYTNSMTQAQVAAMEQIGMIYQNPEMSPGQQRAAVNGVYDKLGETYDTLESLYGNLPGVDFEFETPDGIGDDWGITDPRAPGGGGGGDVDDGAVDDQNRGLLDDRV